MKAFVRTVTLLGLLAIAHVLSYRPWQPDACWNCIFLLHTHARNERSSSSSLKTLATAQADYRANDRDGNGTKEFWRGDVASLYGLIPPGTSDRIKLIEITMAGADAKPTTDVAAFTQRSPKAGYWYKAIRHADEDPTKLDPQRFAFCAYPMDEYTKHKPMFVISEGNTIFKAPAVKGGVDVFPTLEGLKAGWSKLD